MKTRKWTSTPKLKDLYPDTTLAVVIGRFQPFHNGHLDLIQKAREIAPHVLILVGSSFIAPNIKNPFTFEERVQMIQPNLWKDNEPHNGVTIEPIVDDLYNDQRWSGEVQAAITKTLQEIGKPDGSVVLVGHHKDESSYYLDIFPGYLVHESDRTNVTDGAFIRSRLLGPGAIVKIDVPPTVVRFLEGWIQSPAGKLLTAEYHFNQNYQKQFANLPYPPTFVTTDAVVICNGHILLIQRKSHPGKGLWALPGGFLGQNETVNESMIRELVEETKLYTAVEILRYSLKGTHVFDAPGRSLRGRTITHAGLFVLTGKTLPKVKGADDAKKAKWIPIDKFYEMSAELFEDHYSIATYMINRV